MITREEKLYLEKCFLAAANEGDEAIIEKLKKYYNEININTQDKETGRTAAHLAANNKNEKIYHLLLQLGCNPNLLDKGGFSAYELMVNPYDFNPSFSDLLMHEKYRYFQFIISEINHKNTFKNSRLIYVHRLEEINELIEQHSSLTKIGFLVRKPNCIRTIGMYGNRLIRNLHMTPIYFERKNNQEIFVQLDSILGSYYLLPNTSKPSIKRFSFYSGFNRQASGDGCFEDAVLLLSKLLAHNNFNFLQFCNQNAKKDSTCLKSLTSEERIVFKKYHRAQMEGNLDAKGQKMLPGLTRKHDVEKLKDFYHMKNIPTITTVFQLESLPDILIPHIAFYATMRFFRISQPERFLKKPKDSSSESTTMLYSILKNGSTRFPGMKYDDILQKISNPNPLYDFKGKDLQERVTVFNAYHQSRHKMLYSLFYYRLPLINRVEKDHLANKIISFATGIEKHSNISLDK
jgi:hypothetical protein